MHDYLEKRDFPRMILESTARYTPDGAIDSKETFIKDLSSSGMLIIVSEEIAIDSPLLVTITPLSEVTPPLNAEVKVLRCDRLEDNGDGERFAVACLVERFQEREHKQAANF